MWKALFPHGRREVHRGRRRGREAVPVLIPALGSEIDLPSLLDACDGLLLTGSASNVEPQHYGGPASKPGTLHDPNRDATTLPLIPRAIAAGLPVLAICRGFQEMNVAYGGTLHPRLHEVPGYLDHRDDESTPLDVQYAPAHEVLLEPGGVLQKIAGQNRLQVNSLHWQGIETLGKDLVIEARAPDGVIEAFRVAHAPNFALSVQWHPEWQFAQNPFSSALFAAFGEASRKRKCCKVIYGQHDSTILERTRHLGSRSHHSGHGRGGARQTHARGKICRRGGHAPARGDLSADGDRRLSGRSKRHESVGHRHRTEGGPENGAGGTLGRGTDSPGDPRLLLRRRAAGHHGAALCAAADSGSV